MICTVRRSAAGTCAFASPPAVTPDAAVDVGCERCSVPPHAEEFVDPNVWSSTRHRSAPSAIA
jgi:hypothetical protein